MKPASPAKRRSGRSARKKRNRSLAGEKVRFDERALQRIPLAERAMLLGVWHATNELNTLRKLILLVNNNKTKGELEGSAKTLTGFLLIKMFAVKAVEAWVLFKKAQNFPEFREKYLGHAVSADLVKEKDWLNSYFGKSNILEKVRKKFGAHYDYDMVSTGAANLRKLDSFIFLTKSQGNSLYWVAEELQVRSLVELCDPDQGFGVVFSTLLGDVHEVADHFTSMAQLISIIAIEESGNIRNFRLSLSHKVRARLYETADIPFFVDFSAFLEK